MNFYNNSLLQMMLLNNKSPAVRDERFQAPKIYDEGLTDRSFMVTRNHDPYIKENRDYENSEDIHR